MISIAEKVLDRRMESNSSVNKETLVTMMDV